MSLQASQGSRKSWHSVRADGVGQALAESDPKTVGFKNVGMDQTQVTGWPAKCIRIYREEGL